MCCSCEEVYAFAILDRKCTKVIAHARALIREMGLLGDTAKGILILAVVIWVFAIFEFIKMNQIALAILFLIGFIIPLSIIAYAYLKNRKKQRTLS